MASQAGIVVSHHEVETHQHSSELSDHLEREAVAASGSGSASRQGNTSTAVSSRAGTPHLSCSEAASISPQGDQTGMLEHDYGLVDQDHPEGDGPSPTGEEYIDVYEEYEDDEEEEESDEQPGSSTSVVQRSEGTEQRFQAEVSEMKDTIDGLMLYNIVDKIGEGTFSSVYKAVDLYHDYYDNTIWTNKSPHPPHHLIGATRPPRRDKAVYVALKRIYVTSSPDRILNELEIMEDLRGCQNIAYLVTAFRTEDQIVAVMPYTRHMDFRQYYRVITMGGIRQYMTCLFNALAQTHSVNIIHRDVKPANFLYNPATGEGTLCDFGLAERFDPSDWKGKCHHTCPTPEQPRGAVAINTDVYSVHTQPGGELDPKRPRKAATMGPPQKVERVGYPKDEKRGGVRANRAGTRGFRAPEVLFKCQDQTAAVDVWSAGIVLLAFLTKRFPIFNANTDIEALLELTVIFGKSKIARCALLHNRTFNCTVPLDRPEGYKVFDLILKLNPDLMTVPEALEGTVNPDEYIEDVQLAMDLCRVCLHVDVTRRWTAEECLEHPFLRLESE